ncbi:MAG: hypothetical protein Q9195_005117 [Heterodermia aff. obscurata]
MSMFSYPRLHRISREKLSSLILSPGTASRLAIVDVRDADHAGGHIVGSIHVPSSSLDYRTPELVRKLAEKELVVFHCALSQQRGPSAALRYLRERESRGYGKPDEGAKGLGQDAGDVRETSEKEDVLREVGIEGEPEKERESVMLKDVEPNLKPGKKAANQEVFVLDGGFVQWQELYGKDERLTEAYAPDIWIDY